MLENCKIKRRKQMFYHDLVQRVPIVLHSFKDLRNKVIDDFYSLPAPPPVQCPRATVSLRTLVWIFLPSSFSSIFRNLTHAQCGRCYSNFNMGGSPPSQLFEKGFGNCIRASSWLEHIVLPEQHPIWAQVHWVGASFQSAKPLWVMSIKKRRKSQHLFQLWQEP